MLQVKETSRLCFELMSENDAELMFQLDQDPQVMKFITRGKCPTRDDITNVFIPRMQAYTNPDKGWGLWKIMRRNSGDFLGWVLVRPMYFFDDEKPTALDDLELGWRLHRRYWGLGYATEAAQAIADALIATGEINYLTALAMEENVGSIGVMKKLGMAYVKSDTHQDPLGALDVAYYRCAVSELTG
ncbi:GNAT family N-acetyltransferase [Neiella marina]|uniref:GNAT family N-acetyltransferase n=1 Tax=Neiella holothuriorum TaxID=2870530 RepID=A0ABS7ECN6_9GAMM|nr:GNAT family N-acetyltransferase [Neiella holothuriorum]MBW8190101.1 GNAT family N-acetyltransferase [Neiella holothuriorum]